jgi:uncharacterized membrane protein
MILSLSSVVAAIKLIHIVTGAVALLTCLIPIMSHKGGQLHRNTGKLYAWASLFSSLAAMGLTLWRIGFDPAKTVSSQNFAFFLFYLALFALTSLQQGLAALRQSNPITTNKSMTTLALPTLLLLASLSLFIISVTGKLWLNLLFAILGFVSAKQHFSYWLRPYTQPGQRIIYHIENMFAACIATITAFAVTALPRLFPVMDSHKTLLWVLPTVLMVQWMNWQRDTYIAQTNQTPNPGRSRSTS